MDECFASIYVNNGSKKSMIAIAGNRESIIFSRFLERSLDACFSEQDESVQIGGSDSIAIGI